MDDFGGSRGQLAAAASEETAEAARDKKKRDRNLRKIDAGIFLPLAAAAIL